MSVREGYLEREAAAWPRLQAALDAGRDALGWSGSAVAGHIAFWMSRAADALSSMADGTFDREAFATDVDAENDRLLPTWDAMPVERARADLEAARARVLAAWSRLDEPDDTAAGWFAGDTFEHYDEHVGGAGGS
ncbi:MAG: hypothetical protein U0V56_10065 [Actinomycetota bacterium]